MNSSKRLPIYAHRFLYSVSPFLGVVTVIAILAGINSLLIVDLDSMGSPIILVVCIICVVLAGVLGARPLFRIVPARCPKCSGEAYISAKHDKSDPNYYQCVDCGGDHPMDIVPGAVVFGGSVFALIGLFVMGLSIYSNYPGINDSQRWITFFSGMVFLLTGLLIMGSWSLVLGLVEKRFSKVRDINWEQVLGGSVAAILGLILVLVSYMGRDESNFSSGRGAVLSAGLAFFFAGAAILAPMIIKGKVYSKIVGPLLGILVLAGLTGVPVMSAIGNSAPVLLFGIGAVGLTIAFGLYHVVKALSGSKKAGYITFAIAVILLIVIQVFLIRMNH